MKRVILLADDSPTIQRLVTQTFQGANYEIVAVSNGDAAIRKFEDIKPALILADIYMPGRNGYEVCAFVKKHQQLSATPVVLLAGAFDAFDEATAHQVGAATHVTKPFEPQALVNLVESLLSEADKRRKPAETVPEESAPAVIEATAPPREEPAAREEPSVSTESRPSESEPELAEAVAEPEAVVEPQAAMKVESEAAPEVAPEPVIVAETSTDAQSAAEPEVSRSQEPPAPKTGETVAAPTPVEPRMPVPVVHSSPVLSPSLPDTAGGDLLGLQELFKPSFADRSAQALTEDEIDRIAERVIQKLSTQVIESVAWDVVPDITTKVLREELKRQS